MVLSIFQLPLGMNHSHERSFSSHSFEHLEKLAGIDGGGPTIGLQMWQTIAWLREVNWIRNTNHILTSFLHVGDASPLPWLAWYWHNEQRVCVEDLNPMGHQGKKSEIYEFIHKSGRDL
jgi:hypothetical protein